MHLTLNPVSCPLYPLMPSADKFEYVMMSSDVRNRQRGFSIIELIVAIILVSIIAVSLFSRFSNQGAFSPAIARDNAIALALQAQQTALGRENVSFEIDPEGADWRFSVAVSGAVIRSVVVPGTNLLLQTGAQSGTCTADLNDAITSNFRITYDGTGNATGFTNSISAPEAVTNGVRICVNDRTDFSACISPAGFAYLGDCDE